MSEKTIGHVIDELWEIQQELDEIKLTISSLEESKREIQHRFDEKEKEIFQLFGKQDLDGAVGTNVVAKIDRRTVAKINDYEQLKKFILRNKAFDLLQRRISLTAYRERLADGKKVPGLEPVVLSSIKLKKL